MHGVCREPCRLARNMKFVTVKDGREKELRVCQFGCRKFALLNNNQPTGLLFLHFHFCFFVVLVQSSPRHSFHFRCKRKKEKNRINLQLLCCSQACMEKSNPIARSPRPSRRSRALKHSLSERSLTLELLSSPFVLVICPPPRSNSLVHLPKIFHPNHNRHPSHPHPVPCRQTHRPSDGNNNGLLRSDSAHGLLHGLTQCFGRWVPCGRACW
jgi:hypothetical protein